MKKQLIIGVLAILVLVVLGWILVLKNGGDKPLPPQEIVPIATTTEPTIIKIDEHLTINNELRDVNFCGKTYKVKQVMIDGVDVVQRIAELATKGLIADFLGGHLAKEKKSQEIFKERIAKEICENANPKYSETIPIKWKEIIRSEESSLRDDPSVYPLMIDDNWFFVSDLSGNIYMTDGFSGSPMGPIGKLK